VNSAFCDRGPCQSQAPGAGPCAIVQTWLRILVLLALPWPMGAAAADDHRC